VIKFLLCEVGAHKVLTVIQAYITLKFNNEISRTKMSRAHMSKFQEIIHGQQFEAHFMRKIFKFKHILEKI
jgi:CRISPR/Cas system CSM-associated protein Csm3 (group 7 of RAMP superfamily)